MNNRIKKVMVKVQTLVGECFEVDVPISSSLDCILEIKDSPLAD